jgi:hypothetical protein
MATTDQMRRLADENVIYLSRRLSGGGAMAGLGVGGPGKTEVIQGRLRQALTGDWVFNVSGQNGVVGLVLGQESGWAWSETPAQGIRLQITSSIIQAQIVDAMGTTTPIVLSEEILLTTVIPSEFTE